MRGCFRGFILGLVLCWVSSGEAQTNSRAASSNGSWVNLVTKEYPDGTRVVVRWADLGGQDMDQGKAHGGPPKIVAFDPQRDGLVPIGEVKTPPAVTTMPESPAPSASQPIARVQKTEAYEPDVIYGRFQLGLTFINDQSISQIDGQSTSTHLTFDPGLRGVIEIGGNIMGEYLALEGNLGAAWNSCNQGDTAALFQIPAMIGLLGKYPIQLEGGTKITPYFGIDGGVDAMIYDSIYIPASNQTPEYSGSPSYLVPCWQIRTGVLIGLQDKWALAVGYSFLGSWGNLGTSSDLNLGFLGTNSIELGFQTQF